MSPGKCILLILIRTRSILGYLPHSRRFFLAGLAGTILARYDHFNRSNMLGRFADVDANSVIAPILPFLAYSVDFVCPFTKSDVYAIFHMCICVAIRFASCVYVCVCLSYRKKSGRFVLCGLDAVMIICSSYSPTEMVWKSVFFGVSLTKAIIKTLWFLNGTKPRRRRMLIECASVRKTGCRWNCERLYTFILRIQTPKMHLSASLWFLHSKKRSHRWRNDIFCWKMSICWIQSMRLDTFVLLLLDFVAQMVPGRAAPLHFSCAIKKNAPNIVIICKIWLLNNSTASIGIFPHLLWSNERRVDESI